MAIYYFRTDDKSLWMALQKGGGAHDARWYGYPPEAMQYGEIHFLTLADLRNALNSMETHE